MIPTVKRLRADGRKLAIMPQSYLGTGYTVYEYRDPGVSARVVYYLQIGQGVIWLNYRGRDKLMRMVKDSIGTYLPEPLP